MTTRKAYEGKERKLVLAFDVGTTFSGISYSILEPGQVPLTKGVTRFPGHDSTNGASKIPTIVYYDKSGAVCAVGAEATRDGIDLEAMDHEWVKAEWFKMHLRSKDTTIGGPVEANKEAEIYPLPPGKSAIDVLADFLRHLHSCAAQYIRESHVNGDTIWESVKDNISYVLTHPNGWAGSEQNKIRTAVYKSGILTEDKHHRLSFVTEGEASLNFCIQQGIVSDLHTSKAPGFIVVDAGGGTIDISAYRETIERKEKVFEEIAPALCIFEGSIYVNVYAKKYLSSHLKSSKFKNDIDHIADVFAKSAKLRFSNENDPQYLKFGGMRDNDPRRNIKFGQLKLEGATVAEFFKPSIDAIVDAIVKQINSTIYVISHVLFVGGFSASSWLFNGVSKALAIKDATLHVVRPEAQLSKAVADGAISFFLDHYVRIRVTRAFYGIEMGVQLDNTNPEHLKRSANAYVDADGMKRLRDVFGIILARKVQISEASTNRAAYRLDPNPYWMDIDKDNFILLCTAEADTANIPKEKDISPEGQEYEALSYFVVISFGLTEINAHIEWTTSEGIIARGPAKLVYNTE